MSTKKSGTVKVAKKPTLTGKLDNMCLVYKNKEFTFIPPEEDEYTMIAPDCDALPYSTDGITLQEIISLVLEKGIHPAAVTLSFDTGLLEGVDDGCCPCLWFIRDVTPAAIEKYEAEMAVYRKAKIAERKQKLAAELAALETEYNKLDNKPACEAKRGRTA